MKQLSEVTKEDAMEILKADSRIDGFFISGKWKLEDRTGDIGEPCKFLFARTKAFQFWFFNEDIDMEENDHPDKVLEFFGIRAAVSYKCYIKAHDLGYYVPVLSDAFDRLKEQMEEECQDKLYYDAMERDEISNL